MKIRVFTVKMQKLVPVYDVVAQGQYLLHLNGWVDPPESSSSPWIHALCLVSDLMEVLIGGAGWKVSISESNGNISWMPPVVDANVCLWLVLLSVGSSG